MGSGDADGLWIWLRTRKPQSEDERQYIEDVTRNKRRASRLARQARQKAERQRIRLINRAPLY